MAQSQHPAQPACTSFTRRLYISRLLKVVSAIPREDDNPWVIAGKLPGTHLTDLQRPWQRIRKRADLEDVRIHDPRHSFASRALALGESLTMIGKLLDTPRCRPRHATLTSPGIRCRPPLRASLRASAGTCWATRPASFRDLPADPPGRYQELRTVRTATVPFIRAVHFSSGTLPARTSKTRVATSSVARINASTRLSSTSAAPSYSATLRLRCA